MAENAAPIIVIGAGGHAKVLIDTLLRLGRRVLGLTDANAASWGSQVLGARVLGGDDKLADYAPSEVELVNALGSTDARGLRLRERVFKDMKSRGYRFATLVHPSAVLGAEVSVGEGAQLLAGVVVQAGARIGEGTIVNTRSSIDHDCDIGAHCHIAPGVVFSGGVRMGPASHVGTASVVIQNIVIGDGVTIGAGSTVVGDVPDGAWVFGTPARPRQTVTKGTR